MLGGARKFLSELICIGQALWYYCWSLCSRKDTKIQSCFLLLLKHKRSCTWSCLTLDCRSKLNYCSGHMICFLIGRKEEQADSCCTLHTPAIARPYTKSVFWCESAIATVWLSHEQRQCLPSRGASLSAIQSVRNFCHEALPRSTTDIVCPLAPCCCTKF
jgi:hypothetical protein